jgi:hypothetical protein
MAPGQHRVRVRVGHRDHVRLLDRVEAGDGRAVEAHPVGERVLELLAADGEALQLPVDVGEPEPDELDAVLVGAGDDVLRLGAGLGGGCHLCVSFSTSVLLRAFLGAGTAPGP